jgi:hypothetical protein
MQGFSSADLLRVWEHGLGQHPVDRALTLLAVTLPADEDGSTLADVPIGERDELLLDLRTSTFGAHMNGTTTCPRCGERVEIAFLTADVRCHVAAAENDDGAPPTVRALTSRDLAAAAQCTNVGAARDLLAARCVLADGGNIDLTEITRLLEQADPGLSRVLDVSCPCGHGWECDFDISAFLWIEIEAAALRLLRDVHAIARAYGWPERDILAMSPIRRRAYLELVM